MGYDNYGNSYSVEDNIKAEAKNIVNGIENNKHIVEEINPKTGKLEKKVKVICSEERRKETGNFFEEFKRQSL